MLNKSSFQKEIACQLMLTAEITLVLFSKMHALRFYIEEKYYEIKSINDKDIHEQNSVIFWDRVYIYRVSQKNGPPKKNFNNFITLRYFFLKFYSLMQRPILHLSAKFYFNIARLENFTPF